MGDRKMPTAIGGAIDKRLEELKGLDDDGSVRHEMEESGEDVPAEVYTKPSTTKVFSDGSIRKWDDYEQKWKVVKPGR